MNLYIVNNIQGEKKRGRKRKNIDYWREKNGIGYTSVEFHSREGTYTIWNDYEENVIQFYFESNVFSSYFNFDFKFQLRKKEIEMMLEKIPPKCSKINFMLRHIFYFIPDEKCQCKGFYKFEDVIINASCYPNACCHTVYKINEGQINLTRQEIINLLSEKGYKIPFHFL
jgi:hypothetical protein